MPYHLQRFLSLTTPSPSLPIPFETKEEFQEQLTEMKLERDTWKRRYQAAERENETLKGQLEQQEHTLFTQRQQIIKRDDLLLQKDALLRQDAKRKKRFMDSFSSSHSDSDDPTASRV